MTVTPPDPERGAGSGPEYTIHTLRIGGDRDDRPGVRRRRIPLRFWVIGVLVAVIVAITATGGIRNWWAHRLHDLTGGSSAADFVIGTVVGLLPLIGVAVGSLGAHGIRRIGRMFVFGAAGFCITYLLSPSPVSRLASDGGWRVFDDRAPGYLAGIITGEAFWLVVLVFAWWRLRRWRRTRFAGSRQPGPRGPGYDAR